MRSGLETLVGLVVLETLSRDPEHVRFELGPHAIQVLGGEKRVCVREMYMTQCYTNSYTRCISETSTHDGTKQLIESHQQDYSSSSRCF